MIQHEAPDQTMGIEYDAEFIKSNPILSICRKCKRREPINAPTLKQCLCFWCGGSLGPVDILSYRLRLDTLDSHLAKGQLEMF